MTIHLIQLLVIVVLAALGCWVNQNLTPDGFLRKLVHVLIVFVAVLLVLASLGLISTGITLQV